jgi:hypothetical protein
MTVRKTEIKMGTRDYARCHTEGGTWEETDKGEEI